MTMSDPVANMFSIIRNANMKFKQNVTFPFSKIKMAICEKLAENNFIKCWFDEKKMIIKVRISYWNKESNINSIKKISKPSQRIYLGVKEIAKKCNNRKGIYIISTPIGLLTHKESIEKRQGGELIAFIN